MPSGTAAERRGGVWNELLREMAISSDRLWTFIRTLSGLIGESADDMFVSGDSNQAAARDIEEKKKEISKRVADLQAKLTEIVVSSLLKDSGLTLGTQQGGTPIVIDAETKKQLSDLASGQSGRPFFEANVALRSLADSSSSQPRDLQAMLSAFRAIGDDLKDSLLSELAESGGVGASIEELTRPRNSYFVRLRDDVLAAIRASYDRVLVELRLRGLRNVYLFELIEGFDHLLCSRFADLVGHVLVANRNSTGVSAMYTSRAQLSTNSVQAHVAMQRLINQLASYASKTPAPDFSRQREDYFQRGAERMDTFSSLPWVEPFAYRNSSKLTTHLHTVRSGLHVSGLLY
jgi:hypothetical protein